MRLRLISFALVLVCFLGSSVLGSVVGTITGKLTDGTTKEPLLGVSVAIQGTTMGAVTDENGVYRIHNVPIGNYTLVLSSMGYTTVEVSNIDVSVGVVTYHDQEMTTRVTELDETIRVTGERPLIIRDQTTSIDIIEKDELLAMPTRGFEDLVGIQNSVVRMNSGSFLQRQRGQRAGKGTGSELILRGGRPSEIAYYVDGFSQQDPLTGISTANINNNAIQEVSVTSGAFSAEYGHVASGIVNVITSSGSDKYHGNVDLVTDQIVGESFDHNYYSADLGGPIPGLEKGYFFISGERRYIADRTPSPRTKEMHEVWGADFGLDELYSENPHRLPSNSLEGWSYQGKLDYSFTPEFKVQLSGNGSIDNWRDYRQEWALNPEHAPRYKDKNLGLNAKITHTLNEDFFYNLSGSYFMTERLAGDGVIFDDLDGYRRQYVWDDGQVSDVVNPEFGEHNLFWTPSEEIIVTRIGDTLYDNWLDTTIVGTDTTFANPLDTIQTLDSLTLDKTSYYPGFTHRKSSYLGLKGDMTYQVNANHTLRAGFDAQRHTLRYYRNLDATKEYEPANNVMVNHYGFDAYGNESDDQGYKNEAKHPINLGVFVEDRLEWRGLIVLAGLRFDYFDYRALKLKVPEAPFLDGQYLDSLDFEDLEPSEKFYRFSPRIGVSFPVSDRTQMHINFGKFFQRPDLNKLYVGYDFLEARVRAGSYYPFPSPALEPEKITQYEVGLSHQLGENVAFDLTAYYKDVQGLTQIFHQTPAFPRAYDVFSNIDFGTIKGLDLALTMKRTRNLRMNIHYTLSYATGTGSFAQSSYIINWSNPKFPPKTTSPLDYDQRHNVSAVFDLRTTAKEGPRVGDYWPLENTSLNVILVAGSGTPYTPSYTYDEATEAAVRPQPRGTINSTSKPWIFNIDLKLEREFSISDFEITPYFWVKNLLDRENIVGVYESTGKPTVTGYLQTDAAQTTIEQSEVEGTMYQEHYELKQFSSANYSNPRMFFLGLRMSF